MSHSRRRFLWASALTLPALACASIASAAERPGADSALPTGLPDGVLKGDGRATCPLCLAGQPCLEHLT